MTDTQTDRYAPDRIWAQDANPIECTFIGGGWWDDTCGITQYPHVVEYIRADIHQAILAERDALKAAQSITLENIEPDDGFWKSCSGCHETNQGAETGDYPYSSTFKCYLGAGCTECGGLGAIWDSTDYYALEPDPITPAEAAKVLLSGIPNPIFDQLKSAMIGEFHLDFIGKDEEGNEINYARAVPWTEIKSIIRTALRAIAGEGGRE